MEAEDKEEFISAMTEAIEAAKRQVKRETALESVSKAGSTFVSNLVTVFVLPVMTLFAWNGLTPESFPDWNYWPTLIGLLVVRVILSWVRANNE